MAALTQTGARLVHHGQLQGRRVRLPVFLGRFPAEPVDDHLAEFYRPALGRCADPTFRDGHWELCDRSGWPGNNSFENLVAWSWDGGTRWLIVVNLSDATATGRVRAPWPDLRGHRWRLTDPTQDITFDRDGDDLVDGLYVELDAWHWHLLRLDPIPDDPTGDPAVAAPVRRSRVTRRGGWIGPWWPSHRSATLMEALRPMNPATTTTNSPGLLDTARTQPCRMLFHSAARLRPHPDAHAGGAREPRPASGTTEAAG